MVTYEVSKVSGPVVDDKWGRWERVRVFKNVLFVSVAFMFIFIAYNGTANLQSSLNPDTGIPSLLAVYVFFIGSTIFLAVPLVSFIDEKYAILLSIIGYASYTAAQFYPSLWALVVTGSLVGIAAGPLWCSKCIYLTIIAEAYSKHVGIRCEVVIVKFFGIFYALFQVAQIVGSFISSFVFSIEERTEVTDQDALASHCGIYFSPFYNFTENSNLEKPNQVLTNTVFGIYLGSICVAFFIVWFGMDALKRYDPDRSSKVPASGKDLLLATVKLSIESSQFLLIPFVIYTGLAVGYLSVDFTKAFIACSIGIQNVGYVTMTYGICNCISSLLFSHLPQFIDRLFLISFATILTIGIIIAKFLWIPTSDGVFVLHVFAGLWGLGEGILTVQIISFEGLLFPDREDIAFANYRIWEAVGFIISYFLSPLLTTGYILGLVLAFLVVGFLLYLIDEFFYRRNAKWDEANVVTVSIINKSYKYY